MKMSEISIYAIHRIIKNAGAHRVSEDAAEALSMHVEEYTLIVAKRAIELSIHAGRKTVRAEDIDLALKD
tara:strand:- start:102 stop:311 length:210 start_codon:yes stop_codon:yes gene_type:complete